MGVVDHNKCIGTEAHSLSFVHSNFFLIQLSIYVIVLISVHIALFLYTPMTYNSMSFCFLFFFHQQS